MAIEYVEEGVNRLTGEDLTNIPQELIEEQRLFWAEVARKNDWYQEPFYVQVWLDDEGSLDDSISFQGLTEDVVLVVSDSYYDEEEDF